MKNKTYPIHQYRMTNVSHNQNSLTFIKCKISQLIVIVGVIGCGKTTFATTLLNSHKNAILYDTNDFLENLQNIRQNLQKGKYVILTTNQFCDMSIYLEFLEKIKISNLQYAIKTFCIIPNLEKCFANLLKREKDFIQLKPYLTQLADLYKKFNCFDLRYLNSDLFEMD